MIPTSYINEQGRCWAAPSKFLPLTFAEKSKKKEPSQWSSNSRPKISSSISPSYASYIPRSNAVFRSENASPHPYLLHPNNRLVQRRLIPGQRPLLAPLRLHGMDPRHRRNTPVVEPHPTFPADGLVRVVGFVAAAVGLVVLWLVEAVEGEGVVIVVATAAGRVREVVPE